MPDETERYFDELFGEQHVMAILRGYAPDETVKRVVQAWDLGVENVEVPVETPAAMPSLLAALEAAAERGKVVGAGTITSVEQLEAVAEAGVGYTVAPGFDPEVSARSVALGLPHLPGVSTATEIQAAMRQGHRWVKAFPASILGTAWFTTMHGPFPQLSFVATGGMDVDNTEAFLRAGVQVVALGSALARADQWGRIAALLRGFPD